MRPVTFRVPGSTSNLGSGFDTIGLAVNLFSDVTVRRAERTRYVDPSSENAVADEMVREAADHFFKTTGRRTFGIEVTSGGTLPHGRGLGASAALRAGVIAGLNHFAGARLKHQELLNLVTDLEGHPDNASPALLGGATVSGMVDQEVRCLRFEVSARLKLVTAIPDFRVATEEARRLLPKTYSRADGAHALNRSALIAAALASKNYRALAGAFDDRFHQTYREPLIPKLREAIQAGEKAGAIGGFLSGSGSAIICLTLGPSSPIVAALEKVCPEARVSVLKADNRGLRRMQT
jgi:homoserine kinase